MDAGSYGDADAVLARGLDLSLAPTQIAEDLTVPGTLRAIGNGNKETLKPILPELYDVLLDYVLKRGLKTADASGQRDFLLAQKTGRPFRRLLIERRTKEWGRRAGVADCTPHRFRHSFASDLLARGVDIRLIQELLDHADLRSTQIYTRVVNAQAFAAMMKLSARPGLGGQATGNAPAGAPGLQSGVLHPEISPEPGDR